MAKHNHKKEHKNNTRQKKYAVAQTQQITFQQQIQSLGMESGQRQVIRENNSVIKDEKQKIQKHLDDMKKMSVPHIPTESDNHVHQALLLPHTTLGWVGLTLFIMAHLQGNEAASVRKRKSETSNDDLFPHANLPHRDEPVEHTIPTRTPVIIDTTETKNPELCKRIDKTLNAMVYKLPESNDLLERVIKGGAKVYCVDPSTLQLLTGSNDVNAIFVTQLNTILITSHSEAYTIHHELIHADWTRRHQTQFCNNLFSNIEAKKLQTDNILNQKTPPQSLNGSPIWPPSKKNIEALSGIIFQEINSKRIHNLIAIQNKLFLKQPLSDSEQDIYNQYIRLLKDNIIIPTASFAFKVDPTKTKVIDGKFIYEGIILKFDSEMQIGNDVIFTGTLTDPLSVILNNRYQAISTYNIMKDRPLDALSELDAYLRQGLPDALVKELFPKLHQNLEDEKACCDAGDKTKCHRF